MISWLLIGLLIVAAIILLKFKEIRHRGGLFIVIILILFLIVTVSRVYANNKVDLNSVDGIIKVGKLYVAWLGNVFHNSIQTTGFAVKLDWGFNLSSNASQIIK